MRILLVDDHDLFREGLKYLLPVLDDKVQYFEAGSLDEALAQTSGELSIDLILLDYHMPGVDGMGALQRCRDNFESATLVIVSGEDDPRIIHQAIENGAAGFIPKSSSREELISALKLVMAGGTYLPPHALKPISSHHQASTAEVRDEADQALRAKLTRRQFQVLMKAVQGKPNRVIGEELFISDHTVKAHLSIAFRTLGVRNRTEAVYTAARLGIQPDQANRYDEAHSQ